MRVAGSSHSLRRSSGCRLLGFGFDLVADPVLTIHLHGAIRTQTVLEGDDVLALHIQNEETRLHITTEEISIERRAREKKRRERKKKKKKKRKKNTK
jgi:hypothetical protein